MASKTAMGRLGGIAGDHDDAAGQVMIRLAVARPLAAGQVGKIKIIVGYFHVMSLS